MKAVSKDFLKENNRKVVFNSIHRHSPISRTQIVKETGLSKVTVTRAVNELIKKGFVREGESAASNGGRPQVLIRLVPEARYAIGVDVGIYKIKAGLCDLAGDVVSKVERDIAPKLNVAGLAEVITGAAEELIGSRNMKREKVLGLGVAMLGVIDSERGIVKSSFILADREVSLGQELDGRLKMAIVIDRDANAGLFYERYMGKGKGTDDILYVYTRNNEKGELGIGCSLLLGGRIYRGADYYAGEVGLARGSDEGLSRLLSFEGTTSFAGPEMADRVGGIVAFLVNLLNPGLVIIGGDFSAAGQEFLGPVEDSLRRHIFDFSDRNIRIEPSKANGDSGIKAAAFMVIAKLLGYH